MRIIGERRFFLDSTICLRKTFEFWLLLWRMRYLWPQEN